MDRALKVLLFVVGVAIGHFATLQGTAEAAVSGAVRTAINNFMANSVNPRISTIVNVSDASLTSAQIADLRNLLEIRTRLIQIRDEP